MLTGVDNTSDSLPEIISVYIRNAHCASYILNNSVVSEKYSGRTSLNMERARPFRCSDRQDALHMHFTTAPTSGTHGFAATMALAI